MKLHATEAVALVELWVGIKNYVPTKDQQSCAEQFIANIDEAGLVEIGSSSSELYGICDIFDKALKAYMVENDLEETADYDEDWDE
jgi:hypothetical protein